EIRFAVCEYQPSGVSGIGRTLLSDAG
ncbi:D-isomer specific 2-hydroxyacid dehydrogenase, NAD binding domain protein, partial [Vibrio cholerae CP1035(8)]